jgi:tetratricopeptide (TPR) repeat protein
MALMATALWSSAVLAQCPPERDTSDLRASLHTRLLNAQSEPEAAAIAEQIWKIWLTAPDPHAQELLDRGIARRETWDLELSEALFDRLIDYCPDYVEGYNQRAFARFLRQDYDGALEDIDRVLAVNPYHFGALSGKALALMQQGRVRLAQKALRDALGVHPFLRERYMLADTDQKL